MRRLASLLALGALLAGCGEKAEPELAGEPSPPPRGTQAPPAGDGVGGVRLELVGRFASPVFLAQPRGERALYVVEQAGRVVRLAPDRGRSTFLDLRRQVSCCGEQGLLSIAFHPRYRQNGRVLASFTNRAGDTRVVEYRRSRRDPARADARTARTIFRADQPFPNHNGGLVAWGPDGRLYLGLGDGGGAGDPLRTAQDPDSPLGKLLVLHPRGEREPEPHLIGLRNPWRFSFDGPTGGIWIGDVGQSSQEEVDFVPADAEGANLGWSAYEGTERFNRDESAPDAIPPVLTYGRERGCSIAGGYVVRDRRLPDLLGRYLYGDFCAGALRSFSAASAAGSGRAGDDRALGLQVPSLSSFALDAAGRVYALSLDGPVYRLEPGR